MTLAAGSRLGPYEILGQIGAGGMGEVYRAKDPRLGREVAIKVLPASFSQDADRLRRFEQEAKAAGVLNHPNITAVYDIGQHDGAPYVVQELLEGETLRSTLAGGRLSPRKAIEYSLQIAQGLSAAHGKGIVHRDLKPENVFVTSDNRVKILDFGLAKLTQLEGGVASANESADGDRGHGARRRAGHARLHVARAGARQARRRAQRHLLLRRDPLRDALGQESVPRRLGRGHDVGHPQGRPAGSLRHQPEHLAGPRAHRPPLPREESRPALPVRSRPRVQPRGALRNLRTIARARRTARALRTPAVARDRRPGGDRRGVRGRPSALEAGGRFPADLPAHHVPARQHRQRPLRAGRQDGRVRLLVGGLSDRGLYDAAGKRRIDAARLQERGALRGVLDGRAPSVPARGFPLRQQRCRYARPRTAGRRIAARDPRIRGEGRLGARWEGHRDHPVHRGDEPARVPDRQGPLRESAIALRDPVLAAGRSHRLHGAGRDSPRRRISPERSRSSRRACAESLWSGRLPERRSGSTTAAATAKAGCAPSISPGSPASWRAHPGGSSPTT